MRPQREAHVHIWLAQQLMMSHLRQQMVVADQATPNQRKLALRLTALIASADYFRALHVNNICSALCSAQVVRSVCQRYCLRGGDIKMTPSPRTKRKGTTLLLVCRANSCIFTGMQTHMGNEGSIRSSLLHMQGGTPLLSILRIMRRHTGR